MAKFERTTDGLRDAIMSEMEDMRAGIVTPDEANAFALLAKQVIDSMQADLNKQVLEYKRVDDDRRHEEALHEIRLEKLRETNKTLLIRHKKYAEAIEDGAS
jgi:uncharacterized protein (UPF0248 family)